MLLAKILDPETGLIEVQDVDFRRGSEITRLREAGYLDFEPAEQPMAEPGKAVVETLEVADGKLVQSWHIMDAEATESHKNG